VANLNQLTEAKVIIDTILKINRSHVNKKITKELEK